MSDLSKAVILTGPTGHLGYEMCKSLLQEYIVIGISRRASSLIPNFSPSTSCKGYFSIDFDFSFDDMEELIPRISSLIADNNLTLVGLVNNAYSFYPKDPLSVSIADVSKSCEGIFAAPIRLSISLVDILTPVTNTYSPCIINISSMYSFVSPKPACYTDQVAVNALLYGSFKASLNQATRYLSSQFAVKNIRCNAVCYGPFPSEDVQIDNPLFINRLSSHTHLNRIGKAEECAGIINFLLSNNASYITGAIIPVDGGWSAW